MSRSALRWAACAACLLSVASGRWSHAADPLDWPHWRGPEQNGISREKGLPESWSPDGENLLWQKPELATRSTPIVMNGKLYFLANLNAFSGKEGERVVCADAATGNILWENKFNVFLSDVPDTRVAWSSVVGDPETGDIFALGVCGWLACIDGNSGQTKWSHSMSEEYGLLSTYGGRTNFPIVHKDLVIISSVVIGWGEMARPAHRFLAFDKRNGQPVWFNSTKPLPEDTTYSTPTTAVVNGQSVMVFGSGDGGVYGFQPETGAPLFNYMVSIRGINTSPTIVGNIAYGGHSEENIDSSEMGALFALDISKSGDLMKGGGQIWREKEVFIGRAAPLVVGDRIYAIDDSGNLFVVDAKTGKTIGKTKTGTLAFGSPVYADGKIYACESNGRWFVFKPDAEKGVTTAHKLKLSGNVFASPVISHGRIYLATTEGMYCIGKADQKPEADPRPELPKESDPMEDQAPALVQVVPCESLLRSGPQGHTQRHVVRLYNKKGQFIRNARSDEVQFSVTGPGSVDAGGRFATPVENQHGAAILTAKFGELSGTSRIRFMADIPWEFDFNDGRVPEQWVGMRYRNIVIDHDLYKKLEGQNPLVARLYVWFRSGFINNPGPPGTPLVYDNTTPQQRWTEFLRFAGMIESVKTIDDAKATLDPHLNALKAEAVLADWTWEDLKEQGVRLTVKRGEDPVKGNGVMCKITTIPKGTRSQGWMGAPLYSKQTITADVSSAIRDGKMGDAGVIAQRYRLDLMGAGQEIKLISWISHEVKYKTVKFEWKPDTWYTLKLVTDHVEKEGRKVAVLKGKVWVRGEKEPDAWTIEWEDEPANEVGSPGLFGNASNAEVFFDNVKVVNN